MITLHLLGFYHIRTSTEVRCFREPFVSICASPVFFSSLSLESWKPLVHHHFSLRTWGSLSTAIYSVELDCRSPICLYSLSTFTKFATITEQLIRPVELWGFTWLLCENSPVVHQWSQEAFQTSSPECSMQNHRNVQNRAFQRLRTLPCLSVVFSGDSFFLSPVLTVDPL